MVIIGILIVFATFYAIVKNYETRTVLALSGLIMASIGGQPMAAIDSFIKEMANPGLVPIICSVMGFSCVMEYTGCSKHLVNFTAGGLKHIKFVLIPGTVDFLFRNCFAECIRAWCDSRGNHDSTIDEKWCPSGNGSQRGVSWYLGLCNNTWQYV